MRRDLLFVAVVALLTLVLTLVAIFLPVPMVLTLIGIVVVVGAAVGPIHDAVYTKKNTTPRTK